MQFLATIFTDFIHKLAKAGVFWLTLSGLAGRITQKSFT